MAELIGVVSGVMGVVLPVISQIEQLVDRSQNFRAAPSVFRDLKSHCESVTDSLHQLEGKLQQNASIAPEHIQQLTNDARVVNENFEKAKAECEKLEKYFPATRHESFSCHGWLSRSRQALLRFLFAGRIARKCEEISGIIKDANLNGTALNHFLHTTVQINHVNNQVKQVGVGVANVDKKVDTIDKGVKHVGAGVTSMNEMLTTIKENTERSAADATDAFKCEYHVPGLSQGIILDFSTCDAEGVHVTMEGKLKRALLENESQSEFSRVAVAVGAGGMGGVGKTNALLGLGWDTDVREQFKNGGIYFLSVGKDAGVGDVIEELAMAVQVSGGARRARDVRESKTLRGAIEVVVSWFQERETLFLCDDMWETAQSSVGYLKELKQLLTPRGRSRMVLSTRDQRIANAAGMPIEFGPRDPKGDLSRAILLKYAGISEEVVSRSCEKCPEAIRKILRTCGGIPLTLGVAGRAVQMKARYCDGGLQTAIVLYAAELETSTRNMMTEDIEGYPNFCATVRTSLDMVDMWAQKNEIVGAKGAALVCSDLFTRMSVFPRQSRVPQSAVKKLWGDAENDDVIRIIDKLVDLNLLSKREDENNGVFVWLHDLVLEYCVIRTRRDLHSFHRDFLGSYLTVSKHLIAESATVGDCLSDKLSNALESRAWWSLSSAGYFPENVCRHLWKGGCVGELMALLCDVRWTAFRMRSGGLLGWKSDFESLTNALSEVKNESRSVDDWNKVETGFGLVREAVNEAWGYLQGNERELGMQVYSRLFNVDEGALAVSRYLRSVRAHCERPWLLPRGRYWALPGTSANVELVVGVDTESIAMTNDGSVVAVGVGQEVLVMNVESRLVLWRRAGHEKNVTCLCISGDGAMIVSGSSDKTLRRWDGRSGVPLGEPLYGHDKWVNCVAMSQDGALIVSGSYDGTLRRWDGRNGAPLGEPLCGHDGLVNCVAMSQDGAMIVSGSSDKTLRRWDGRSGVPLGEPLYGHDGLVNCVAMSQDGALIVSGSYDWTLRRWDGRSGAPLGKPLRGHDGLVNCVAMSQDGAMIVSGSSDKTLRRWDGLSGVPLGEPLYGHDDWVNCVAMSQDGALIVSGWNVGTFRQWDGRCEAPLYEPLYGHERAVNCIAMSQDGALIVSGSYDGTLCRWDGRSGVPLGEPMCEHKRPVNCIAMSQDGALIVSGSDDRTLRRWDGRSGVPLGEPLYGHKRAVNCVAMSQDGALIVSGSYDGTLCRWDGRSGVPLGEPMCEHKRPVNCIAMSQDGALIVSGSDDRTLRRWDGRSGVPLGEPLYGHKRAVNCVAMSQDGAMILSSSFGTVWLWNAHTGSAIRTPVPGAIPKGFEIENEFWLRLGWMGSDKIGKQVEGEEFEGFAGWSVDTDGVGGSDVPSSCVLRVSSCRVIWDGPTGVHVLATLPADIKELCVKRVSFRARGSGEDDGKSSYAVCAVAAFGLRNGMVCIFHLVTE